MAKTLFVTPDYTSEFTQCRTLKTPNNAEWLGVFNKALLTMLEPYNWEQINDTDLTIDATIAIVTTIINEYWDTDVCCEVDACLMPDDLRVLRLSPTGYIQQLANGAWIEPTDDYAIPPTPERTGGTESERICLAAANAASVLKQLYEEVSDLVAAEATQTEIALAFTAALAAFIGGWIVLPVLALVEAAVLLFAAFVAIARFIAADLWGTDFEDNLKCILYDCAVVTGDVVTFDFECVDTSLVTTEGISFEDAMIQVRLLGQVKFMLQIIGADGLNAAGATTGITVEDCTACTAWCYQVDLEVTNGGFNPEYAGTYVGGAGWRTQNKVIGTQRTIVEGSFLFSSTLALTDIGYLYNYTAGNVNTGVVANGCWINNYSTEIVKVMMGTQANGTGLQKNIVGVWNVNRLDFDLQTYHGGYGGVATLRGVTIHGTGAKPTFLEASGWTEC